MVPLNLILSTLCQQFVFLTSLHFILYYQLGLLYHTICVFVNDMYMFLNYGDKIEYYQNTNLTTARPVVAHYSQQA